MSIRNMKGKVNYKIPVKNVIVSVFDKTGLETFIPGLIKASPDVKFMSTGGTFKKIQSILEDSQLDVEQYLMQVSEYTDFPEMEGGLVKTLHPKIHAGLLGERNNPAHQEYLKNELEGGVFIDMVISNLYPFSEVIAKPDSTFEQARGNIDIGGPTMMRAGAKNFPSCMVVSNPENYEGILTYMNVNGGVTGFIQRLKGAAEVFDKTGGYDNIISNHFNKIIAGGIDNILAQYDFVEGSMNGGGLSK